MILISIIYSAVAYPERVKFIAASGKDMSRHFILTAYPPLIKIEGVEMLAPSENMSAWRFWLFAFKEVRRIIKSYDSKDKIIVHEYLSGVTNFMLRFFTGNRIFRITSLYSVEIAFLYKQGWQEDRFSRKFISLYQRFVWIKKSVPIVARNILACIGSNVIIGNSTAVTDDVKLLFPNKPTWVINTSVDIEKFHPSLHDKDRLGRVKLVFFSRVNPAKGLGLLLEALRQLRDEGVDFDLDIIGDAWDFEKEWLDNLLTSYDAYNFYRVLGRLSHEELLPYLRTSDVLIFPSYYEGSPRAVKEAMAVGLACLVSDLPGSRMLDVDGEAILFFERGGLNDLKEKMRDLIRFKQSGELEERSMKLREKALLFSREIVAEKQLKMYNGIFTI